MPRSTPTSTPSSRSTSSARSRISSRAAEWLHGLGQDLRVAARALRRAPGFAAVVVLTLAFGIGANAMMFGIVDRLLLRPPAYLRDADRTGRVYFTRTMNGRESTNAAVGYATLREVREATAGVLDVVAVTTGQGVIGDGAAARSGTVGKASGEFWSLFDARPAFGRYFGPLDDRLPAGAPVAVLAYDVAQRRRDYGIRLALGAPRGGVLRLVLRRGLGVALGGVALGLALALLAGRAVAGLLFGVSPYDPLTFGGVTVLLGAVALAAGLVPGWRAARGDPAVSLRAD